MDYINNNEISYMTEFRKFLYTNIYIDENLLLKLVSYLTNSLSVINHELDIENKVIKFKIRKSIYKKKSSFTHNVLYYYPIINEAFRNFIADMALNCLINNETLNFINNSNISLLYNITCIDDNIIIIQL